MEWRQLLSRTRAGEKNLDDTASDKYRSIFEQDYDRIIFSQPFRKLQDKTQVFPLPEHDFVHTRLTHSLEVSSVGRSLGKKAGSVILSRNQGLAAQGISDSDIGAIVSAASLAHDLGNPPFGHTGEDAISGFFSHEKKGLFFKDKVSPKEWNDLSDFEGNAQGFRILNRGKFQGLKLTDATLAAFSKYPRESSLSSLDENRRSQKKYGFFQAEKEGFSSMASKMGLRDLGDKNEMVWCRHPLAFLVEAADDICYHIIDLEDGCNLGLVSLDRTIDLLALILGSKFDRKKLDRVDGLSEKIGLLRAITIGVLIDQCVDLFADNESELLEGAFDSALTDEISSTLALKEIKAESIEKIYRANVVVQTEAAGFEVLPGLLGELHMQHIIIVSHAIHLPTSTNPSSGYCLLKY